MTQSLIAYAIVFVALLYAVWLFLPYAARRWLAARLMGMVPVSWRSCFAQQARAQSAGCSTCRGCATDARPAAHKPVLLHRR